MRSFHDFKSKKKRIQILIYNMFMQEIATALIVSFPSILPWFMHLLLSLFLFLY